MSHALPRRARAAALALALVAVSGCGAGFEAQTYQERSNAESENDAVGAIALRNLSVAPDRDGVHEAGSDADVTVTLVNEGDEDDRLVGASSPAAASVELVEDGEEVDTVELPRLQTTGNRLGLRLVDLTEDLPSGAAVEITLQFERNGEITLTVPVATTGEYDEDRERSGNFHPPGEEQHESGTTGDSANEGESEG